MLPVVADSSLTGQWGRVAKHMFEQVVSFRLFPQSGAIRQAVHPRREQRVLLVATQKFPSPTPPVLIIGGGVVIGDRPLCPILDTVQLLS
ncbi:hypothetical protein BV908_19315 [Diaphorobacter sp. LR2014-1]|nr:hypothetical protein BV908_19315 [Diaphorobacter sp. LR2014-1]